MNTRTRWSGVRITAPRSPDDCAPCEALTHGSHVCSCPSFPLNSALEKESTGTASLNDPDRPHHTAAVVSERRHANPALQGIDPQGHPHTRLSPEIDIDTSGMSARQEPARVCPVNGVIGGFKISRSSSASGRRRRSGLAWRTDRLSRPRPGGFRSCYLLSIMDFGHQRPRGLSP